MTTAAYVRRYAGQTAEITMTPVGATSLSAVISVNGRETDRDVADFDSKADRDQAFAETCALYESNGYTRAKEATDDRH